MLSKAGWLCAIIFKESVILALSLSEIAVRSVPLTGDILPGIRFYYHPDYRYHYLPNQNLRPLFGKRVNINRHGLRTTQNYTRARTEGIRRILVLGDSVSFGLNVDSQSWAD